MRLNENYIELKIFDFENHEEISNILNLKPTNVWKKGEEYLFGDKTKGIKKIRKENYWEYRSKEITNEWIGNQIEKFIKEIIEPRIELIKKISNKFHSEFSVVQYMYDGCNPGLYFDKKILKVINECGLELNIDFYVLQGTE